MAYTNFIANGWEKEYRVFNKYFDLLTKHPGKDPVHNVRVAIKKLRAIQGLFIILTNATPDHYPLKKIDHFFNTLGKQRDIEICIELLAQFEKETGLTFPEQKRFFLSLLALALKRSGKAVSAYKKKELDAITILLNEASSNVIDDSLFNKTKAIIKTHFSDCRKYFNKPHRLRQHLKEIYYWIKIIPDSFKNEMKYDKNLHQLLNDFGRWQDLQIYSDRMRHFRKDYLTKTSDEYELTKKLEKTVNEKKEKLLKATLIKTNTLLKKIELFYKNKSDSL